MEDSHRIRAVLSLLNIKPGLLLRHYDFEETGRYRKVIFRAFKDNKIFWVNSLYIFCNW